MTFNFNDIFQSSFLENVSSFSALDTVIALGLAFVLGLFIITIYKKTFNGVMYSASFAISLLCLTMITTLIILAISSNVILSLGMVGALSIVRFRSAIKEPMDLAYLFWAIAVGIILGAGFIPLAVFGTIVIGIIMMVFVNKKSSDNPYILIIDCQDEKAETAVNQTVAAAVKKHLVKSKTVSTKGIELTLEVRLPDMTTEFVNRVAAINGVNNAVLVSYNGEYMS